MSLSWVPEISKEQISRHTDGVGEPIIFRKFSGEINSPYHYSELQDQALYLDKEKEDILGYFHSRGLQVSFLHQNEEDFEGVLAYLKNRYAPTHAQEICAFDLYRFTEFGYGLLLKDRNSQIVGTIFELFYDTAIPSSFTIRLSIDESLKGYNLGHKLMKYSSLLSMEKGVKVKRAIVEINNSISLHVNLNKTGWICDGFLPKIPGLGSFFKISLPLSPYGLETNTVDKEVISSFLEKKRKGIDYQLIPFMDEDNLKRLYAETDFLVVSFLPSGWINEEAFYLAVPRASLN
ncbi:MAG: hypothetical protein AAGC85_18695 [Bacteroidota bacterium]